jgi:T5SS/PEP-CTERM-associated repeat protein
MGLTGAVTVTDAGSTWNSGPLSVGVFGRGMITIESCGALTSNNAQIGSGAGSIGIVTITGAGSTWNAGTLFVANGGAGMLSIQNGGTLSNGEAYIASGPNTSGTVTVDGTGSLWTNSSLQIGNDFFSNGIGTATVNIYNGGIVSVDGSFSVQKNGIIQSDGTGNIVGDLYDYRGTISPGVLPGRLRIDGSLAHNEMGIDGELLFSLASATSFAKLEVTGDVSLGGILEVIRLGGYNPAAGATYDILDWGGNLSGEFSTIRLPILAPGLSWDTSELYTTGVLSVTADVLTGDMDCDGDVDFDDIDEFVLGLNNPEEYENQVGVPPETKGDTDGDGDMDFDDIDDFVSILTSSNSLVTLTVPEPGTAGLFSISLGVFALCGRLTRPGTINHEAVDCHVGMQPRCL